MFLNTIMLAGIAGAAIPLLLHLLSRARCRTVPWGAMLFLQGGDSRQRRSTRLKQWLLLAMRMSLVSLLAVALARPVSAGRLSAFGQQGSVTAVILLDHSASMATGRPGHTRLDEATATVRQILATLHHGDEVALILLGQSMPSATVQPTSNLQSILDSLHAPQFQTAGWGVANMADALKLAADVFTRAANPERQLFIVCDRQAINWHDVTDDFTAQWRQHTSATTDAPKFLVVPVGGWETGGLGVESIVVDSPQIVVKQPTDVEITVHNFGSTPRASIALALSVDDRPATSTTVAVAAGSSSAIRQSIVIDTPGSHVITAKIESAAGDGRTANQLSRAVDVVNPIDVLIVRPPAPPGRPPLDYLKLALMPFASAAHGGADMATVTVQEYSPTADWSNLDGRKYRVVVLDNIAQLTPAHAKALEQHVYSGGGLLISPGPSTDVENLNATLYRDGSGILPAALGRPTSAEAAGITGIDRSHAIFRFLANKPDPDPQAAVGRYFPILSVQSDARVLAAAASSPLVLAGSFGRGRVVLITTPLNQDWNTLPRTNFYLPMVQSMIRFLAAASDRNLDPGQPIVARFDTSCDMPRTAQVLTPSGFPHDVPLQPAGDWCEARFADTAEPGVYTVSQGRQKLHFVITPAREEADLTPLSQRGWQALAEKLGFHLVEPSPTSITVALGDDRAPRELWALLLTMVIVLGIGEVLLEGKFSQAPAPSSLETIA